MLGTQPKPAACTHFPTQIHKSTVLKELKRSHNLANWSGHTCWHATPTMLQCIEHVCWWATHGCHGTHDNKYMDRPISLLLCPVTHAKRCVPLEVPAALRCLLAIKITPNLATLCYPHCSRGLPNYKGAENKSPTQTFSEDAKCRIRLG